MALVILQFDQPLVLPVDAAGLTISDNNGGTFTASSVAFGANNKLLEYTGTWSPDDPVNGVDVVRVQYDKATGAIIGTGGMIVESFNVVASYLSSEVSPVITLGPVNTTVTEPDPFTLTMSATNASTYQWYETTAGLLVGETASSLTINPSVGGTFGYYCIATNVTLTAQTATATITVDAASFLNVAPVSASLSYRSFGSMDLTQTLQAPLNRAAPEFNTTRF